MEEELKKENEVLTPEQLKQTEKKKPFALFRFLATLFLVVGVIGVVASLVLIVQYMNDELESAAELISTIAGTLSAFFLNQFILVLLKIEENTRKD